ncbi:hypothetical protein [Snodgrassella communis]|uniref:hypothetical protein n=1 Tax=Snodgrassella communis TaxID=2946699 RepID=UPI001EF5F793|nr:hypothetical protein [Snodgrassella communis]
MFKGYYINGVAVKDNGPICFLAKEIRDDLDPVLDEELYKKRLVVYHYNEHGDEQWGNVTMSGRDAMCIATITRLLSQVIVADMNGLSMQLEVVLKRTTKYLMIQLLQIFAPLAAMLMWRVLLDM